MKKVILSMLCMVFVLITIHLMPAKVSADVVKDMTDIKFGKTIEGNLEGGSTNTFVIKPTKTGKLTITIKAYIEEIVQASLCSSENEEINLMQAASYDATKGYSTIKYSVYVSPRTYYLKLTNPIVVNNGSYKITTKFTAVSSAEAKSNNNTASAFTLGNNKYYRGTLAFDEMDDYYRIKFAKAGKLKLAIDCNDQETVNVTIKNSKGNIIDSGWAYYNSKIYSYDQKVAAGTYSIIINKGGKVDSVGRYYNITTGSYAAITAIKLPSKKTLMIGDTFTIKPTVTPKTATETYSYSSSNTKIVKVSSKGAVTAVKKGTASITVKTTDRGIVSNCKVTITDVPVTKVTLNKTKASLYVGERVALKATVSPKNATETTISWKSADMKVATVSSQGIVTAKGNGMCKITATAGGKSAISIIEVKKKPVKKKPTITPTPTVKPTQKPPAPTVAPVTIYVERISMLSSLNLSVGDTKKLNVSIVPDDASNKALTWSSTDDSIVSVENGEIICKKLGKATIIVTSSNGKKAYCTVVVKE